MDELKARISKAPGPHLARSSPDRDVLYLEIREEDPARDVAFPSFGVPDISL